MISYSLNFIIITLLNQYFHARADFSGKNHSYRKWEVSCHCDEQDIQLEDETTKDIIKKTVKGAKPIKESTTQSHCPKFFL